MATILFKKKHHWKTQRHWITEQRATIGILIAFSIPAPSSLNEHVKILSGRGGPLPEDAQKAFVELKTALISEPCLAFPRSDRKFTLIVDSAIGSPTAPGGIGAILCQTDELGHLHPISYASRALNKHECNYSAFLVELIGCVFGIEHFSSYL